MALLVDMLVAILTTKLSAMPKGLSPRLGLYGQVQRNPSGKEVTFGHAPATFPADEKLHLAKADQNHMG